MALEGDPYLFTAKTSSKEVVSAELEVRPDFNPELAMQELEDLGSPELTTRLKDYTAAELNAMGEYLKEQSKKLDIDLGDTALLLQDEILSRELTPEEMEIVKLGEDLTKKLIERYDYDGMPGVPSTFKTPSGADYKIHVMTSSNVPSESRIIIYQGSSWDRNGVLINIGSLWRAMSAWKSIGGEHIAFNNSREEFSSSDNAISRQRAEQYDNWLDFNFAGEGIAYPELSNSHSLSPLFRAFELPEDQSGADKLKIILDYLLNEFSDTNKTHKVEYYNREIVETRIE